MPSRASPVRLTGDLTYLYQSEVAGLGLEGRGPGALASADLYRYRGMALAAAPNLTERQWRLLSHVIGDWEFHAFARREQDQLPGANYIAAEIMDWMRAGGSEQTPKWARELYDAALAWQPITVAGVVLRLREEAARKVDAHAGE